MLKKLIVFVPLCLTACAGSNTSGPGSQTLAVEDRALGGILSDQGIRFKIIWDLVDFSGYELTVYKGRVLLTGVVPNQQVKSEIVRIAKRVEGVREVIDRMKVEEEDGFAEYARDGWMTTKLNAALFADEDVNTPSFVVRTFDKVIYIFGTAQNQAEMQRVLDHAYGITGVRKVVNYIDVKTPSRAS